ncbi:MAG: HRDC domain-containing protein [Gemmatimonadota bacterium]|jgi:ribonuclease D
MSYVHIGSADSAGELQSDLASTDRFALDCEAAGFHRYSDRLCLIQLTTERATYIIDPIAFDPTELLSGPLEDPDVEIVMHGADFDLRLLSRDLGIELRGLFDTQIAAQLLAEESIGLQALLESRLGVKLSKKYQRADWAERPLDDAMLEYAANDTRYLMRLADILTGELEEAGRTAWAEEECRALELAAGVVESEPAEPEDPVVRVKGARKLPTRAVAALRVALEWRDEIARRKDRAIFRVVANGPLVEAVMERPKHVGDLTRIKGFPSRLAKEEGDELLRRLDEIGRLPESELRPYPRTPRTGRGRPSPEIEELADRLKDVRNRKAAEVGLPRGTLLANAVLLEVALAAPADREQLLAVDGMREWRVDVIGDELLETIRRSG